MTKLAPLAVLKDLLRVFRNCCIVECYIGCADMNNVNASIQFHDLLTPEIHVILILHRALHDCIQIIAQLFIVTMPHIRVWP